MRTFELKKKADLESSIYAIALVENPAIEVGFVALSKEGVVEVKLKMDEEQRMIYTPVLIPNQKILRADENGEAYQIYFSSETIKEAARDYLKAGSLVSKFNNEHNENEPIEGVTVVESWIVDNKPNDKSVHLGFDVPVGTWMQGIKIDNEQVWSLVKEGKYKGISIEGLFDNFETELSKSIINNNTMSEKIKEVRSLRTMLKSIFGVKLGSAELTEGGVVYFEGDNLEDGQNVFSDEVMEMPMVDGEYVLADGRVLEVSGGIAASIREVEAEEEADMKKDKEEMSSEDVNLAIVEIAERLKALEDKHASLSSSFAELSKEKEELAKESEAKVESLEKETGELKAELSKLKETPAKVSVEKLTAIEDEKPSRFNELKLKAQRGRK